MYTFQARAVNNQSVAGPAGQDRAATAPASPAGLTATPGLKQAALSWDNPSYPSITAWQYRQADRKGGLAAFGGNGEADLFWTAPANTAAIAKWQYSSDDGATWTDIPGSGKTTTSYTVPNLTNDTAYTFKVQALNSSNAMVLGTVSGNPSATPSTAAGWTGISNSGASTTSHTVTGLTNHAAYAFQVRAVNPAGSGLPSTPATTRTPGPPYVPTGLKATSGDRQAALDWNHSADASITRYEFRYKTTGDYPATWTTIPQSNRDTAFHRVTGLTGGVKHTFQVRAVNDYGAGPEATVEVTPASLAPKPATPSDFKAWGRDGEVHMSWSGTWSSSDFVEWQLLTREARQSRSLIVGSGGATKVRLHWHNPGATGKTEWEYRQGEVSGNSITWGEWTAIPCASPSCDTLAHYHFAPALTEDSLYAYQVQATVSGSKVSASQVKAWGVISAAVTTRAHQQDGLTNGTAYRFLLRAVYRSDEGAPAAAGATPTAAPSKPTGFGVTAGRGEARLKWKVSTDEFLDKYQYRYKTDGSYGAWTDMLPARLCTLPAGEYPPDNNNRTKDCTVTDDLFYRVTGLDDGTTYTFQIRGFINSGPGGYPGTASDEVSATTPQSVPNWPANFSARAGNARIDMSWDKPPADSGITKWEIRYIESNGAWVGLEHIHPHHRRQQDVPRTHRADQRRLVSGGSAGLQLRRLRNIQDSRPPAYIAVGRAGEPDGHGRRRAGNPRLDHRQPGRQPNPQMGPSTEEEYGILLRSVEEDFRLCLRQVLYRDRPDQRRDLRLQSAGHHDVRRRRGVAGSVGNAPAGQFPRQAG